MNFPSDWFTGPTPESHALVKNVAFSNAKFDEYYIGGHSKFSMENVSFTNITSDHRTPYLIRLKEIITDHNFLRNISLTDSNVGFMSFFRFRPPMIEFSYTVPHLYMRNLTPKHPVFEVDWRLNNNLTFYDLVIEDSILDEPLIWTRQDSD